MYSEYKKPSICDWSALKAVEETTVSDVVKKKRNGHHVLKYEDNLQDSVWMWNAVATETADTNWNVAQKDIISVVQCQ